MNIFGKVKSYFFDRIRGLLVFDCKRVYINGFRDLLLSVGVHETSAEYYTKNFMSMLDKVGDLNNMDRISFVSWLCVFCELEKRLLHIDNIGDIDLGNTFILYGSPGSGKTCFLTKFLRFGGYSCIKYKSDNKNDLLLLRRYSNIAIGHSNDTTTVVECNDSASLLEEISRSIGSKIVFILDINSSYVNLMNCINNGIDFDFVVITKLDGLVENNIGILLDYCCIGKGKIIFCVNSEISSKKSLVTSSTLINLLAKVILKRNIQDKDLKSLVYGENFDIDLNTYRVYLNVICDFDRSKIGNLLDVLKNNQNSLQLNSKLSTVLDKMRDPTVFSNISVKIKEQIYLIDSMNVMERSNPLIISYERQKAIIKGSGTSREVFNIVLEGFRRYKSAINKSDLSVTGFSNLFKDL